MGQSASMNETRPTLVDQFVYGLNRDGIYLSDREQEDTAPENDDNLTFITNHYIPGGNQDIIEQRRRELHKLFIYGDEISDAVVYGDAIDPKTNEPLSMENVVGFYAISQ